jgi:hypothetical protein
VCVLLPVAGSLAVLGQADLDALAQTRRGRYVLALMPVSAQVVRLAADALMGLGHVGAASRSWWPVPPSSRLAGRMRRGREPPAEGDYTTSNDRPRGIGRWLFTSWAAGGSAAVG